jgi:hypothetical protein
MHSLTLVHDAVKDIIEVELHQRGDHTVKAWRSDGGSEFCNSRMDTLLRMHDIKREQTCRGTSFQVGTAERLIGELFAKIRTTLFDSKLPMGFWAEALATAVYVFNRTPGQDGLSPFERRFKRAPKVGHLRPFGTSCAINIPTSDRRGKIAAAAVLGILVGYGYVDGKKGYRAYIPTTRKVVTSYDVTFSDLAKSLQERRAAEPHLVASPADTAAMLEELHPARLLQLEQEHLSTPAVRTGVHETGTMPGDRGGEEQNNVATNINPPAQTSAAAARSPAQIQEQETQPQANEQEENDGDGEDVTATPGYTYLKEDDPFFSTPGLHEQVPAGTPGPVSGRTRSARRRDTTSLANTITYASDCAPAFVAQAATAATDLATNHRTPKHYGEAMASPDRKHWQKAIQTELDAVKAAGTYQLVPLSRVPTGSRVIGYTWVFKIKNHADGTIARFKARICVDGSKQKHGVDFDQTFAPVANATTIRLVLAIAASKGRT